MTEIISYQKKKNQNDATISVILYNSAVKQYSFNRNIQKLTDAGWDSWLSVNGEMSNIIKVYSTCKKIVHDKLRLLFIKG